MKKLKLFALALLGLSMSMSFYACSDDDDDTVQPTSNNGGGSSATQNIAELAIASNELDSLVVALTQANMVSTFQGQGNFTVFAPSNQAFRDFLAIQQVSAIADIPTATLTSVLNYHVLNNEVKAANIMDKMYTPTLNTSGPNNTATNIFLETNRGPVDINQMATVTTADVDATNGVVHIIDAVIQPRNIVQMAITDSRFDSLVVALQTSSANLASVLAGAGPYTVFAPTNQAFVDLLASNPNWNRIADIPDSTLTSTLQYHVLGSNVQAGDLVNGNVSTINNGTLTVDLSNGAQLKTTSNQTVNITITDAQGTNGVIHAIDQVLLQ